MRNLDFFLDACFFSGITALTAFNRNAKGVNAFLVGIKAYGVLLEIEQCKRHYTEK